MGLAAAPLGSNVATTATGSETTTAVTLETTATPLAAGTVVTATGGTTTTLGKAIAAVGVAAGTALLDNDLLAANFVGVSGNGSSVASGLVEFNKGAVLNVT